jgi:hypothetical protein
MPGSVSLRLTGIPPAMLAARRSTRFYAGLLQAGEILGIATISTSFHR